MAEFIIKYGVKMSMTWNSENRMTESVSQNIYSGAKTLTRYKYDHEGNRVIKSSNYGEVVTPSAEISYRNDSIVTKHIFVSGVRVASKVCDEKSSNTYYQSVDHLGSTNVLTDDKGEFYEHIETFPDGSIWVKEFVDQSGVNATYTNYEMDVETKLFYAWARYYDAQLGRFISVDPIIGSYLPTGDRKRDANMPGYGGFYNPRNLNMYSYTFNNPLKFVDPDGNRVVLWARRLNFTLGSVGVHTFIEIIPDNPKDFNGRTRWTISGFGDNGAGGQLVTQTNFPDDLNWNQNDTKGNCVVPAPNGISDTQFIKNIMVAYNRYQSGSRNYAPFPDINQNEGNCNTISTGTLVGAGVPRGFFANIDPNGFNTGLGDPLPEMLPPAPVLNNPVNNSNSNGNRANTGSYQYSRGDPSFSGDPNIHP